MLDSQGKGNQQILTNKTNFNPTKSPSKSSYIGEKITLHNTIVNLGFSFFTSIEDWN